MRVWLASVLLVLTGCARPQVSPRDLTPRTARANELVSDPEEYQDHGISAAAGEDYFARFGGGDPYATGLAYPVFLALLAAYPSELGADLDAFADKFGLLRDPSGHKDTLPIGMHLTRDPITRVPFVMNNCQLCHAARLRLPDGDHLVSGLGSGRIRVHAYDAALARIAEDAGFTEEHLLPIATALARARGIAWPREMQLPIVRETIIKLKERAAARGAEASRLSRGLPGRVATIESFAMALHQYGHAPIPPTGTIGWAKIPDIRGFPYRDTLSWDGVGTGSPVALAAEADFALGARPEWFETHRHIATSLYLYLKHFDRKLAYPLPVDVPLVKRGESVFEATCAKCHGYYSSEGAHGRVRYRERVVPITIVGTDSARLDAVTPEFVAAANAVTLTRGVTTVAKTSGYVPPVLLDVWARGHYGHIGQWPTIEVLATKPANRPRTFVVDMDAPYDLEHLGYRFRVLTDRSNAPALGPGEYVYDGTAPGYGTQGHPFLCDLPTDDRRAVLEYLKTL